MPLINGQKMACEPCIRGHRSTKCSHANERLMVPVRKPGRPLSSCPHPASRPCSCGHVTAAIPKKQRCGCGSKNGPSSKDQFEEDGSNSDSTPQTPSKGISSHRVQKTAYKSSVPGRKPSIDISGLERMDASQLNIIPAYNGLQQSSNVQLNGSMAAVPEIPPYNPMAMPAADAPYNPMAYHMFPQLLPTPMMSPETTKSMTSHQPSRIADESKASAITPSDDSTPQKGSCCGDSKKNTHEVTTQPSTAASTPSEASENASKGCCSSKSSPPSEMKLNTNNFGAVSASNGVMMSPFQTPMVVPGMYPYFAHPTIFTYPPQYGSFMQPLQPEQWRQVMAAMSFGQGMMPATPYGMPEPGTFQQPAATSSVAGTSHQCGCGDGCQCVGCAAHPYNDATRSYIRSAYESMQEEHQHQSSQTNGVHKDKPYQTQANGSLDSSATKGRSHDVPVTTCCSGEGTASPTAPQTPSEAASGISEEQTFSANDFFFVSYPFGGDSCAGETASCPCGDDCQCLGCVIHNNPDPATTEE